MSTHFKKANLTLVLLLIISLSLSGNVKAAPETSGFYRASFTKKSPSNNATGVTISQPTLQWNSTSNVFRYVYCYYSYDLTSNVCDINDKATWKSNGTSTSVQLPTLAPNKKYYWQVGAKLNDNSFIYADGALTSKWAFTTGSGPSVGAGMYDNTHSNWIYTGKWATSTYTGTDTGPYNKTYKESGDIPDYTTFTFTGGRVTLYYTQEPDRGVMNIYMDNSTTPIALNQSGPLTWQKAWMSGALASGIHTIKLVYVSGNSVNIDAIQIYAQADTTAPAAINTLSATTGVTSGTVTLNWTAVGDDGNTAGGAATMYLVRYSTSEILTPTDWDNATVISSGIPTPKTQGQAETMTVTGLTPGQTYYFAVRAQDEQFNLGGLSNSPSTIAYRDTTAPAAINTLSVASGVDAGTVTLNWIAVGDDGNTAGGAATMYLVRYSTSEILTPTDWDNATVISSGIPTPKTQGQAETMTVTGLTPGQTYYFAVRAQDEMLNLGNLSNSPSLRIPVIITYDNTDPGWVYSADWSPYAVDGPYNGTIHYTNTTNATASFTFQAPAIFTFYYAKASNRGAFEIWVDGSLLTTINPYATTKTWKNKYISPVYTDNDEHIIEIKNISTGGKQVDIDAIQIAEPPTPPSPAGPGTYDDTYPGWVYSADWSPYTVSGPHDGTIHYTNTTNATASFTFQAPAVFTFYYAKASNRGAFEIWVDGNLLTTINPYSLTKTWQNKYTSPIYNDSLTHTIKIKNISTGGKQVDIDAIQIITP